MEPPTRKLLDCVSDAVRGKHYSYQTEKSYVQWVRRFILFHNKRHPSEMGGIAFTGLRTWTWRSSSSIAELSIPEPRFLNLFNYLEAVK
ncbi:MAG: phage integrase N-terminal SAM-like domain-containing protein [Pseudanabaena sp.]